jgi:cyd operon protein YbgE
MIEYWTNRVYELTDKSLLRALSLIMALVIAARVFWAPSQFATDTSFLNAVHNLMLVWAVCTGIIHGTGFKPHRWGWRLFFLPLAALVVLAMALFYAFY